MASSDARIAIIIDTKQQKIKCERLKKAHTHTPTHNENQDIIR